MTLSPSRATGETYVHSQVTEEQPSRGFGEEDREQRPVGAAVTRIQRDRAAQRAQGGGPARAEHQPRGVAARRDHLVITNAALPEAGCPVEVGRIGLQGNLVLVT
jgi:hypothetical protein